MGIFNSQKRVKARRQGALQRLRIPNLKIPNGASKSHEDEMRLNHERRLENVKRERETLEKRIKESAPARSSKTKRGKVSTKEADAA